MWRDFEYKDRTSTLSAAGGQAFAAVLGHSAMFGIGDPTMVPIGWKSGAPARSWGRWYNVRITLVFPSGSAKSPIRNSSRAWTLVTSPDPNTNYSVTKKLLTENGLVIGKDVNILQVNPGTEIAATALAGRADVAIAYQPGVSAQAEDRGARSSSTLPRISGLFCNTGIMVLNQTIAQKPVGVSAAPSRRCAALITIPTMSSRSPAPNFRSDLLML